MREGGGGEEEEEEERAVGDEEVKYVGKYLGGRLKF